MIGLFLVVFGTFGDKLPGSVVLRYQGIRGGSSAGVSPLEGGLSGTGSKFCIYVEV